MLCLSDKYTEHEECGSRCIRHSTCQYTLHDFGRPQVLACSKYHCLKCGVFFTHPGRKAIAPRRVPWTNRVIAAVVALRRRNISLKGIEAMLKGKTSRPLAATTIADWCHQFGMRFDPKQDDSLLAATVYANTEISQRSTA